MLKIENISTGYDKKQVLFDISLEINKGETIVVVGSNGSGKSTLLKTIYGLLPLWNNGKIYFEGKSISGKPTSSLLNKGLLYIPQKNNLFENLTVQENLEMAGLTLEYCVYKKALSDVLLRFPIFEELSNRVPQTLSGGERQMLTLAMALLHKPKMIMLDEPLFGLSPNNIRFVIDNIKYLSENDQISFLIVEHKLRECMQIADRLIGLKLGNLYCEMKNDLEFNIDELNTIFV